MAKQRGLSRWGTDLTVILSVVALAGLFYRISDQVSRYKATIDALAVQVKAQSEQLKQQDRDIYELRYWTGIDD